MPRPTANRRRRRLGRAIAFSLVLSGMMFAALEAFSWVAYWLLTGERFSYAAVHEGQARVAASDVVEDADAYSALYALHPYLGYVFDHATPEARDASPYEHGFRNPRGPLRHRSPNRLLVGVFGGSVARDLVKIGGATLKSQLESHPAFAGREVELLKFAVNAYRQPQQVMALQYLLALGGELDVVVNLDGFNEVAGMSAQVNKGIHPAFPRFWEDFAQGRPDPEVRRALGRIEHLGDVRRGLAALCGGVPVPSVTLDLLWTSGDRALQSAIDRQRVALDERPAGRSFAITGARVDLASEEDVFAYTSGLWERCSQQMAEICAARGMRYFHFLQPNQYVIGSKEFTEQERDVAVHEHLNHVRSVRVGYPWLRDSGRALRDGGVEFFDLSMIFRDVAESVYRDECCHLNELGNDLLAQAVAAEVIADAVAHPFGGVTALTDAGVAGLRADPAEFTLRRPFEFGRLRLTALRDGGQSVVPAREIVVRSADPGVAAVLLDGRIEARAPGSTTVTASWGERSVVVPVTVAYGQITPFGIGKRSNGDRAPELSAVVHGDRIEFTVSPVPSAGVCFLRGAVKVERLLQCGAQLYMRPKEFSTVGFSDWSAADRAASISLPLEAPVAGVTYWQAVVLDEGAPCGWTCSNGLAITAVH